MTTISSVISQVLRPGQTVYLPGATGESLALAAELKAQPESADGIRFMGCFVPGINSIDYAGFHPRARLTSFMLPSAMRPSFIDGRTAIVSATYYSAAKTLAAQAFDVAFAQVAPPDANGQCSLGIASDFAPLAWPHAQRRILLVNPQMPAMRGAPSLALADADFVLEADAPLIEAEQRPGDYIVDLIAHLVSQIIPDHATIQTGIGAVPTALWTQLKRHKALTLRSGLVPDGFQALYEAGVMCEGGAHVAGIALGSMDLYQFLSRSNAVSFRSTLETHSVAQLSLCPRFYAINSALEIDLLGRLNVAWQNGRLVGGVGGLGDFARAATAAPQGCSIVALPATANGGMVSRIVPLLQSTSISLGPDAIDVVVTEHGAADLRGLDFHRRAAALIGIAAPKKREALSASWRELSRKLAE